MARLTIEQWQQAKADYEVGGLSQKDIAEKYRLSKGTVSDKVKKEAWQAGKTELTELKKVNAVIGLIETEQETELLNRTEQAVLDIKVADDVAFRLQNDADMEVVRYKAMQILKGVDSASGVKGIMDTLRIQREARLGKSPDTAIQINNGKESEEITRIERVIVEPE